jgi:flavin-binding protein dodecin
MNPMSTDGPEDIPRNIDFFVVEDTQTHLDNLLESLQKLGFHGEVILARSISEGLKLLNLIYQSKTSIDMVISDALTRWSRFRNFTKTQISRHS